MEYDNLPKTTRLRFVKSKKPERIVEFLNALGSRVQIYGSPVWDGKAWWLWFVPDDRKTDVPSLELDKI